MEYDGTRPLSIEELQLEVQREVLRALQRTEKLLGNILTGLYIMGGIAIGLAARYLW